MKRRLTLLLAVLGSCTLLQAQVKIGDNPSNISAGSILELESTNKAFTLPRMTTVQMQAIPSPLNGMIVFNIDSNCIYLYKTNNVWASINPNPEAAVSWPYHSNDQTVGTTGNAQGIIAQTGIGLSATGSYSHAEGKDAVASGNYSWSVGLADTATGEASVAMGSQNIVAASYGFSAGFKNSVAFQSGVALGQENRDTGWSSMALGLRNIINDGVAYSNTLGFGNQVKAGFSHNALGEANVINQGRANFTAGFGNSAAGSFNTLTGNGNTVLAGNAHTLSGLTNTVKGGIGSTVLGWNNVADGFYLGAIGRENSVFFQSSVALGQGNKDSGYASIAGGLSNVIENNVQYSASFGFNNLSTRNFSLPITNPGSATFSAGISNTNAGFGSIALGGYNLATNMYSLAANNSTIANSHGMSAFGHYNDTLAAVPGLGLDAGEMLFSIGNGSSNTNRRNSFTMMRNGFTSINTTAATGPQVPRAELDVKGTGAMIVPVGTTAQRPETPVQGMIRFCTDCGSTPVLQGYDGTNWVDL